MQELAAFLRRRVFLCHVCPLLVKGFFVWSPTCSVPVCRLKAWRLTIFVFFYFVPPVTWRSFVSWRPFVVFVFWRAWTQSGRLSFPFRKVADGSSGAAALCYASFDPPLCFWNSFSVLLVFAHLFTRPPSIKRPTFLLLSNLPVILDCPHQDHFISRPAPFFFPQTSVAYPCVGS